MKFPEIYYCPKCLSEDVKIFMMILNSYQRMFQSNLHISTGNIESRYESICECCSHFMNGDPFPMMSKGELQLVRRNLKINEILDPSDNNSYITTSNCLLLNQ